MPNSYVDIDREEMEYVDGGLSFYVNRNAAATISTWIYAAGFGITVSTALSYMKGKLGSAISLVGKVFKRAALAIGGWVGYAIVGAITAIGANNMVTYLVNCATAGRYFTGVKMEWWGVGFYNPSYY